MVELQKASWVNRGFYVRMKLSHHKNGRSSQEKSFLLRYYKFILWISLSLYFFSPYFISHNNGGGVAASLSKTHVSSPSKSSFISRALLEPVNGSHFLQPQTTSQSQQNIKPIKIYVYDLPRKFNADWLSNARCSSHLFASEVAMHRALLTSGFRTSDPNEADFFFVPVYVSCNFSTVNGFPAIAHARSLLSSAVRFILTDYPFWNRTGGSDHLFVASHDFGACFHAMEAVAEKNGVPDFMKSSVILQTFGVNYNHPCQEVENVVIPPYISPEAVRTTVEIWPTNARRDIFVFFRGKMEVNPKNISGQFYSKKVRTAIWRKFSGDRRFYLKRHRFAGYQSEILRSVFCLCPLGWAPWSPRLVESVVLGCVPVIIADGIRLPFSDVVRWPEISLRVAEKDVGKLGKILEHVARTNLTTIQKNLWDPRNKRALLFNDPIQEGDATWHVMRSLGQKLDRSYRRSMVLSQ